MSAVTLPLVPSIPNYRFGTQLDGVQYIIDVRWNGRDGAWYMDFLQADETPIKYGIKIVLGATLGGLVTDPAFPPGVLIAVDQTGNGREATLDDLGSRVLVVYIPAADIAAV